MQMNYRRSGEMKFCENIAIVISIYIKMNMLRYNNDL